MKRLPLLLLLISIISFAGSLSAAENYVDSKYVKKLDASVRDLGNQLSETKDDKTRYQIISRMNVLYEAYNHPDVRMELVKKRFPKYAAKIQRGKDMTDAEIERDMMGPFLRRVAISKNTTQKGNSISSPWILLSEQERKKICSEAYEKCEDNVDIRYCRFVIDRCRDYIEPDLYKKAEDKVKDKEGRL